MVEQHNEGAARAWGHAGKGYDFISFGLSDGLSHAVQKLWPRPGERILDIATGTGWTARSAAYLGADVTAIDIADGLLDAARQISDPRANGLRFVHADAEDLPFDDASFDGAISTYGIIFAGRPDRAAAELARVVVPGGRMVLTTWAADPDSYIPGFFGLVARYSEAPPPPHSPMIWGDPDWLAQTLGDSFELHITPWETTICAPDAATLWDKYLHGFGPLQLTAEALDPDRLAALRDEFEELHRPYRDGPGLTIRRKAVMVEGRRRG